MVLVATDAVVDVALGEEPGLWGDAGGTWVPRSRRSRVRGGDGGGLR